MTRIERQFFQSMLDGKRTDLYKLENTQGAQVYITNYGAKIVALNVPDKDGNLVDVVLGHPSLDEYISSKEPYFGAVCGRTGNRIAKGKFTLDGVEYNLAINNGPNNLHGGLKGFNAVVWEEVNRTETSVCLRYVSPHLEEGFPGTLTATVTYTLTADNALQIDYQATTDQATVVNLTNHSYFNLSGEGDASVHDHILMINADKYLPTDETAIPLGDADFVENTPMDFRTPHSVGQRIFESFEQLKIGRGYDHTYVLNKESENQLSHCAMCYSPKTMIQMDVYTTEPGVQLYTGNWMDGSFAAKNNHRYPARAALCLETQHFPDSPNHPQYPSVVLRPEQVFASQTVFKFSIHK